MNSNKKSNTKNDYDVNYKKYNNLVYFQLTKKKKLGGFVPKI